MVAAPGDRPPHRVDYGARRRKVVLSLLRDSAFRTANLSDDARLTYALGALVCDSTGRLTRAHLDSAAADPSAVQYARTLLKRAGY